jgi:hypothetical protein
LSDIPETQWHLDKRIPVALIVTLLAYGGIGLWWAAGMEARVLNQGTRIDRLEHAALEGIRGQSLMNERLARIEERSNAQVEILQRIERTLSRTAEPRK